MDLIQEATKACPRDDCSITGGDVGWSTCMGWTPTYDKNGKRTDQGDPNTTRSELRCSKCGQQWIIVSQYGKTEITAQHPWPSPDLKASQHPTVSE